MRLPRFRAKNFSTCTRSPTARGSSHASHSPWDDVAFSSTEGDRHLGIRPVSQLNTWPVVSPVNASRRPSRDAAHHSGSGRMASPYPMGDFHLLFFASFPGALLLWVIRVISTVVHSLPVYPNNRTSSEPDRMSQTRQGRHSSLPYSSRARGTLFDRRVHSNYRRARSRRPLPRCFDGKSIASLISSLRLVFVCSDVELFQLTVYRLL